MSKKSAGLLPYRRRGPVVEVLLVHPGGPWWAKKDLGAWSIAKGGIAPGEEPLETAKREFREETGFAADGDFRPLRPLRQPSGKLVFAWAFEADFNPADLRSNTFEMDWPPGSGALREFPEVDRAGWFPLDVAREKILGGQSGFIDELERMLEGKEAPEGERQR